MLSARLPLRSISLRNSLAWAVVLGLGSACSSNATLAGFGAQCNYDEQCQTGLVCKCVRTASPDDEGPDEVVSPGFCAHSDAVCGDAVSGIVDSSETSVLRETSGTETSVAGAAAETDVAETGGPKGSDAADETDALDASALEGSPDLAD